MHQEVNALRPAVLQAQQVGWHCVGSVQALPAAPLLQVTVILDCLLLVFFIVPGVIALAVDAATGDWNVLEAHQLSVHLTASQAPQPAAVAPAVAPSPPPGCQYDAQCKGERICRAGQCVEPTPTVTAPAVPDGPAPPRSSDGQQPAGH